MRKLVKILIITISLSLLIGCKNQNDEPSPLNIESPLISEEKDLSDTELSEEDYVTDEDKDNTFLIEFDTIQDFVIEEQSFEISLNSWGKVKFTSCLPMLMEHTNPLTDASFYLLKNEKVIYHFPYIFPDNIRESGAYDGISFVMFKDSNKDGKEDIIIGLTYISGAGPQGMIPYTEVRIYEDNEDKFVYNKDLSDEVNLNIPQDATAEDVKKYLGL